MNKVSAYKADNTSLNDGISSNIYQKQKIIQKNIITANCLAHILHKQNHRQENKKLTFKILQFGFKVISASLSKSEQLKEL